MAAMVKSKGTSLLQEISSVYTAFPQLKSVSLSGAKSEVHDVRILDGAVYFSRSPTGYTAPCVISAEVYRDPDNAVHAAFIALLAAPVATNFKVTYADATPLSEVYIGVGFGWDTNAQPTDSLSSTLTIDTSGVPA